MIFLTECQVQGNKFQKLKMKRNHMGQQQYYFTTTFHKEKALQENYRPGAYLEGGPEGSPPLKFGLLYGKIGVC